MKNLKSLTLLAALVSACATFDATPPPEYTVYILNLKDKKLMGKSESTDLQLTTCEDSLESKAQCFVFLKKDYEKLMKDFVERDIKVKACEALPPLQ